MVASACMDVFIAFVGTFIVVCSLIIGLEWLREDSDAK